MGTAANAVHCEPCGKGRIVGQKAPFKFQDLWALRATARCRAWVACIVLSVGWPDLVDARKHEGRRSAPRGVSGSGSPARAQSACLRRNAGISISSMPLLASASTFAAAWLRALRHTLGVFMPV